MSLSKYEKTQLREILEELELGYRWSIFDGKSNLLAMKFALFYGGEARWKYPIAGLERDFDSVPNFDLFDEVNKMVEEKIMAILFFMEYTGKQKNQAKTKRGQR